MRLTDGLIWAYCRARKQAVIIGRVVSLLSCCQDGITAYVPVVVGVRIWHRWSLAETDEEARLVAYRPGNRKSS
jgi:hypothetical protein